MNKKQNYIITTFRYFEGEGYQKGESISLSAQSHNLLKVCEYMESLIVDSDSDCNFVSVSHDFSDGSKFFISFGKDDEFLHFTDEVFDAGLDDYEEWLRSNYKDGVQQSLPASNGKSAEITTEGN